MVEAMSLFNRLLQHFPSLEFASLVEKHKAERASKGFSCQTQLVAMLFCQLVHADSLDSTTISLGLEMFPWAGFRRAKGGVKAHVLLDHHDYLPRYVLITEARRSDVKMAGAFPLNPGSLWRWIAVITHRSGKPWHSVGPADSIQRREGSKGLSMPVTARNGVLLSNLLAFGATTIAAIYKDRWEIELFLKALKQNLKVKSFVGALNLFTCRALNAWLDNPFGTSPILPESQQLTLRPA
jgi:hypothetical protein